MAVVLDCKPQPMTRDLRDVERRCVDAAVGREGKEWFSLFVVNISRNGGSLAVSRRTEDTRRRRGIGCIHSPGASTKQDSEVGVVDDCEGWRLREADFAG